MPQCSAKSKQSGERCKRSASPGHAVCNIHGGKTPRGVAYPQFRHGRYSKALPGGLSELYRRAREDPDALALMEEIALCDTRLADLLSRISTGESGELWKRLSEEFSDFRSALRDGDKGAISSCLSELSRLIERGIGDYAVWREINAQVERRRRLVESERKRAIEQREMLKADEALAMVAYMLSSVKAHVSSPEERAALAADLQRFLAGTGDKALRGNSD